MIRLVVFDIAGTTIRDQDEVLQSFAAACQQEGIVASRERLNALMGMSKLEVFHLLWRETLGPDATPAQIDIKAQHTFQAFRDLLEGYYRIHPVVPTEGALQAFEWLRARDIRIALNTGFYRSVTDLILDRVGWQTGGRPVDFVIASDEVPHGRPEPFMIRAAMQAFSIADPRQVVKIGDTPVDLLEGRRAGCALSLGLTNGTHSRAELEHLDHDGLLSSLQELPDFLLARHLA